MKILCLLIILTLIHGAHTANKERKSKADSSVNNEGDHGTTFEISGMFVLCTSLGIVVGICTVVVLIFVFRRVVTSRKSSIPDQYKLHQEDLKRLDANPSARKFLRKYGYTTDDSMDEYYIQWKKD